MSLPDETPRTLPWAGSFLVELMLDKRLPLRVRGKAREVGHRMSSFFYRLIRGVLAIGVLLGFSMLLGVHFGFHG